MSDSIKPLVYAHRGYRAVVPENTLEAARHGYTCGAEAWELDVTASSDGHLVVIHDDTLRRTTDAASRYPDRSPWDVDDFTLEEIRSLDAGSWFIATDPFGQIAAGTVSQEKLAGFAGLRIPTLEEALLLTKALGWKVNVEIKDATGRPCDTWLVEKTLGLVTALGMEGAVIVSSFNHEYLVRARKAAPAVPVAALTDETPADILDRLRSMGAAAWHPNMKHLDQAAALATLDAGFGLNVWTVNAEADMRSLLAWGATGIITDFVERARTVVDS